MTSFFVVPTFTPPTLEQLTSEPDEVALIVQQEARIHQDVSATGFLPWAGTAAATTLPPPSLLLTTPTARRSSVFPVPAANRS